MASPAVSVLIPAYRAARTLGPCLDAVLTQELGEPFEVVLVVSADRLEELPPVPPDPRLRVETAVPRLGAAAARNRAAAHATGELLVFVDADAVAPAGWLAGLVAAGRRREGDVVAGSVANGTPASAAGTAEYLVQFSELAPVMRVATHGATCNLLVPRRRWDELGPFPEDLGGGEDTLLTLAARRQGRFRFEPGVPVVHLNRTGVREVLAHQRAFGRFTAALARRCEDLPHGWLLRAPFLAPLAVLARIVAVARRAATLHRTAPLPLASAPLAVAALIAWGVGVATGAPRVRVRRR